MIEVPLWLTGEHECSYLDGHKARSLVVGNGSTPDIQLYSELIAKGFRRSGNQIYKPHCRACRACVPTRVSVNDFQPDRRQKRCIKQNADTLVLIKPAEFDDRHFALYQRYQARRHADKPTEPISAADYMQFLGCGWKHTWVVEFSMAGRLSTVAVVDVLDDALSAVYTFFEPDLAAYSPGAYAVLWQIRQAQEMGLDYVYLGYWIRDCRKMRYKNQYQPLYGLIDQQWQAISKQA